MSGKKHKNNGRKYKNIEENLQESELDRFTTQLRNMIASDQVTEASIENENQIKEITDNFDYINNIFLNSLVNDPEIAYQIANSEQIEELNDKKQKRKHRDKVIRIVKNAMMTQIAFMSFIILLVVANITLKFDIFKTLDNENLRLVIGLLQYFISATIVEIVGMLFFIVESLFPRKKTPNIK